MIRKIIGIVICFSAMITQAGAQGLGIELNGGLQGTRYSLQSGQSQGQPGGSLGLSYPFRLGYNWDLLSGVTVGLYRTRASLSDGVFTSYQIDDAGSAFQYSIKTTGYKETQRFFAASVPLLLQYHTTDPGVQWYFDGGGKVFVPFSTSVQVSAQQLSLSGYYPDFNVAVSNLPQHGFGTIKDWKTSATTKLKPAAALSAATGVSFSLGPDKRLYAGLYVDYGLTSLKGKNDSMPLVTYSPTGLTGVQGGSVLSMPNTGKVTLLSFGLQLRLSFGTARPSRPAARPDANKEPQPLVKDTLSDDEYEVIEQSVIFGLLGETSLSDILKRHLDELADILKQHPATRISLVGHICNSETEIEDKKVGAARASAVAQYLESKGIARRRMDVNSLSESDVVEPFNPLANYRNRRVVITVK